MSLVKHQNLEIHIERKSRHNGLGKNDSGIKNADLLNVQQSYGDMQAIRVSNYEMKLGKSNKVNDKKKARAQNVDIDQIVVHKKGYNLTDLNKDLA